jgi:hypothetical protein
MGVKVAAPILPCFVTVFCPVIQYPSGRVNKYFPGKRKCYILAVYISSVFFIIPLAYHFKETTKDALT